MMQKIDSDNRQRHCMVVHAYYPHGETRVERQALALHDHGIDVDVICLRRFDDLGTVTFVDGIEVHRLPVKRHKGDGLFVQLLEYLSFFCLAFFRLTKLHVRKRYDVIQVHNLPDFLVFVALIPKLFGTKIILDLHDLMPEFYAERSQRSLESLPTRIIRWQEMLACKFADHVITVTTLWHQTLIERGQPPEKVSVVMNVADNRIFFQDRIATNLHVSKDIGRFELIYHGTLSYRYGLDLLLKAVDQVRHTIPRVHLTLHGRGEYQKTLETIVEEYNLRDHVSISSYFVSTKELADMIRAADLGIVPYREGVFTSEILPTKLMEFAALGIPAIAARTPAISAYFDDTMVEFFTPESLDELVKSIVRLYHDPARIASLAKNVTKFTKKYNWADQSAKYVKMVMQLVSE